VSPTPKQNPDYTLECRAGRLIEARIFRLRVAEDANGYAAALASRVARVPATSGAVLFADHRAVVVYTQPVADRLGELFANMNARLERVAILVAPTNATLLFQLDRLVRGAANPSRRVFQVPEAALDHLAGALDATERARAQAFVSERQN
jgi:hypothetical protein